MPIFETNPLEVSDELVEILKNRNSLNDFSQKDFDFLLFRPLWGSFVKRSLETGTIPSLPKGLFQGSFYLAPELQNDLIRAYQKLLEAKSGTLGSDVRITESVTVPKERIGTYFDEVFHLLVSNNLYSLRAKVRQNKGKNEDADFDSAGLSMAVMGFTKELGEFDPEKDSEGILYHASRTVASFVQKAHGETRDDNYSPELRKVRKMIEEFVGIKEEESEEDESVPDHSGLTTRQMLEVVLGEIPKTGADFLSKHWESYLYVLGIGKVGYKKISGQEKWESPDDVEAFRKGLVAALKEMDAGQRQRYVSEVSFRVGQMGHFVESLDTPVGGDEDESSLGDFIESREELSVSDKMDIEWFYDVLKKEIYQEKGHKADLSFRDRIILGMMYENAFTIGELYALLEEYDKGYPAKYIDHWDQFGFYGKPEPGNQNHPHSLDEYWKQFFDDGVDPMKASSIAKILNLTEEGVVGMDVRIKDELNKHYKIVGSKEDDVIFKFEYYKYKGTHSESHVLKENYVRTKFPRPKKDR